MLITFCKSKIQGVRITAKELDYEGSITIAKELLKAADILPNEKVQVVNFNNGMRLETYVILGQENSGVCLNGPAARLGEIKDKIIIISYALFDKKEIVDFKPKIVYVDAENKITQVK
ncbi:MAG: aspartate 1-decarboxylase [Candidatus Omnitrophica bacterium]|nr:aspartate 1-decarboxylase [Candidatus Omnitrophota bacterium]